MAFLLSLDSMLLLAGALGLLYLYLTWTFSYWTKRGVKGEKPALFFGSIRDAMLVKRTLGEIFTEMYEKNEGEKAVGWFKFRQPSLLIRDPEVIHKVLVTDFNSFRNNDFEVDENVDPILGRNIFVQKDELWKKNRALLTPAFTTGKIKPIFPQMLAVARDFVEYIRKHPGELHIKNTMSRYTAEIVAKCALGIEGNCFKEEVPVMHEMGKLVFEPDPIKALKMMSLFMFPQITKIFKLKIVPDKVLNFFDSVLRNVIVYRQENDVQRNDLVQYLIDIKRKTIEVEKGNLKSDIVTRTYSDQDVLSGCIMFFIEGYETSSVMLTNVLYKLTKNRDVQERLREEIDAMMKKGEPTFEAISELEYLNWVILETHRTMPVAFNLQKVCTETYEMDVGKSKPLTIEKGTPIIIPLYALHNDPKYWEDADVFKPERFANKGDVSAKAKGIFLPFGDGPRMCIGVRIASTLIKTALVHILSEFEVVRSSKTPDKIIPDPNYFMLAHKGGMYFQFVERRH